MREKSVRYLEEGTKLSSVGAFPFQVTEIRRLYISLREDRHLYEKGASSLGHPECTALSARCTLYRYRAYNRSTVPTWPTIGFVPTAWPIVAIKSSRVPSIYNRWISIFSLFIIIIIFFSFFIDTNKVFVSPGESKSIARYLRARARFSRIKMYIAHGS